MENVLENFDSLIETVDKDIDVKRYEKLELILVYLKFKKAIKSDKAQNLIKENIEEENGKYYIKGTRISTNSIGSFFVTNKIKNFKDLLKEYPSLENEDQITAAMLCFVRDNINLLKIIFIK
nr:MAG TPA: Protein of unknown function (DUF433) [Caudoviricetes sp.]